jgi:hypothetical protein
MSSVIIVHFLSDRTIGRYFQLTALGSILGRLNPQLQSRILSGFEEGSLTLTPTEFDEIARNITDFLKNYVSGKALGVKLYTAGRKDISILRDVGITTSKGMLTYENLINYYQSSLLLGNATNAVPLPMLLRAYVFSKYKDYAEDEEVSVATLYLALAGAVISVIASGIRFGENIYELYLVPDSSTDSIRDSPLLYELLHDPKIKNRIQDYLGVFRRIESLSFELTILLSILLRIYDAFKVYGSLPSLRGSSFEKFKLIGVITEQRPLVVWEKPLSITHILAKLYGSKALDLLGYLYRIASDLPRLSAKVSKLPDVLSQCVLSLIAYIETGSLDMLTYSSGNAVRILDTLDELCVKGDRASCNAKSSLALLLREITYLLAS